MTTERMGLDRSASRGSRDRWVVVEGTGRHRLLVAGTCVIALISLWCGAQFSDHAVGLLTSVFVTAIAVIGLNLATGYAGLLSIGHSALFGMGAYTTGILIVDAQQFPLATLPVAVAVGFVAGLVVGLPALRIRGLYFSLVTLALGVSFPEIIRRFDELTGGAGGLVIRSAQLSPPSWSGFTRFERGAWMYWLSGVSLVIVVLLVRNLMRSQLGVALRGVRDHETAITANGVDVSRTKVLAFAVSGGITAYAGGLMAMNVGALSPDGNSFSLHKSIELVTAMFIGGAGTLIGPLIGAVVVVFLPEVTSAWWQGPISTLLFGLTLIVLVFFMPEGIGGRIRKAFRSVIQVVPGAHRASTPDSRRSAGPGDRSSPIDAETPRSSNDTTER